MTHDMAQSNILVVDDIPDNLTVLRKILENHSYRVRMALNGEMALKSIQKTLPDLVLLDIMMPGMDGYEVCRRLKADVMTHDIPVLFISSLNEPINKINGFEVGAVDYITKPFYAEEVLARVKTHLMLRAAQRQLESQNDQLAHKIAEHQRTAIALKENEQRFRLLFENMTAAFALHEMIYNQQGEPIDYRFLEVNPAFEQLTGLPIATLLGKTVKEVLPNIEPYWIETYGKVARTGKAMAYQNYSQELGKYFDTWSFSPTKDQVAVVFTDITERKLVEDTVKYLASFPERNPNPIMEIDLDGQIQYINLAATRLFSDFGELSQQQWFADLESVIARLQHEESNSITREVSVGNSYYQQALQYIKKEQRVRIYGLDITKRKQIEIELRKLSRAVEQSDNSIVITDLNGTIEFVNAGFIKETGYTFQEAIGQNPRVLKSGYHPLKFYQGLWGTLTKGESWHGEFVNKKKNGELYWESANISPIKDEQGNITHYVAVKEDITARKLTEKQLKLDERRLESLLHLSQMQEPSAHAILDIALEESIVLTDSQIGYIYYYDEKQQRFTLNSWSKEVMSHYSIMKPRTVYDLDKTGIWGEAVRQRKAIIVNDFDAPNPLKRGYPEGHAPLKKFLTIPVIVDNKIVAVAGVGNKIEDYNQTDVRQLILLMDTVWNISQRKQVEEQLRQAKESAESANRSKSVFLTTMSHELRTPLNGILGYAQILKRDGSMTSQQQDGLTVIQQSGEHLLGLINDILDLSKIEANRVELYPTEVNLVAMLRTISNIISVRAEYKGIYFKLETASEYPQTIIVDEQRLRQVLINLLGNAVKFTDKGGVTLRVGIKNQELGIRGQESLISNSQFLIPKIRFEVIDTGVGIAPTDFQTIFEPFEQVGQEKFKAQGTGLGLAISRNLIHLMGGELQVKSELGHGSTFWFELTVPMIALSSNEVDSEDVRRIIGVKGQAPKILVVDDHASNRRVLIDLLSPLGFQMEEAIDGQDGLEKAIEFQPQAIITDLVMPKIDGFALIKQIRQPDFGFKEGNLKASFEIPIKDAQSKIQNLKSKIVIIVSSASAYENDRQKSIESGADAFMPKPIQMDNLLAILRHYLKIEWLYETPSPSIEQAVGKIILPSAEVIAILTEFTLMGDIGGIREQAILLQEDEQLRPFGIELEKLAKKYQIKKIRELMESR